MLDDTLDLSSLDDKIIPHNPRTKPKVKRGASFEHILNELNKIDELEEIKSSQQPRQGSQPDIIGIPKLNLEDNEQKVTSSNKFYMVKQDAAVQRKIKIASKTPTNNLIRGLQNPLPSNNFSSAFSNAVEKLELNTVMQQKALGGSPLEGKDDRPIGQISAVRTPKSSNENPLIKVRLQSHGNEDGKMIINPLLTKMNKITPTIKDLEDGTVGYSPRNRVGNPNDEDFENLKAFPSLSSNEKQFTVRRKSEKSVTTKISLPVVLGSPGDKTPRKLISFDINKELKLQKIALPSNQNEMESGMLSSRRRESQVEEMNGKTDPDYSGRNTEGKDYQFINRNHIRKTNNLVQNYSSARLGGGSDFTLRAVFGGNLNREGDYLDKSPLSAGLSGRVTDWGSIGNQSPASLSDKVRMFGRIEDKSSIFKKIAENELSKPLYVDHN